MRLGDFNGYVGMHVDGCDGAHGWYGVGQRNSEGRMLLEFCLRNYVCQIHCVGERKRGGCH